MSSLSKTFSDDEILYGAPVVLTSKSCRSLQTSIHQVQINVPEYFFLIFLFNNFGKMFLTILIKLKLGLSFTNSHDGYRISVLQLDLWKNITLVC